MPPSVGAPGTASTETHVAGGVSVSMDIDDSLAEHASSARKPGLPSPPPSTLPAAFATAERALSVPPFPRQQEVMQRPCAVPLAFQPLALQGREIRQSLRSLVKAAEEGFRRGRSPTPRGRSRSRVEEGGL